MTFSGQDAKMDLGFLLKERVHTGVATTHRKETTMTNQSIPASHNDTWGFTGTLEDQAAAAWPIAMTTIAAATGQPLESVRAFLDSRHGRHFADDVLNERVKGKDLEQAIHAAAARWMVWTIGRQTSRDYGIPCGLPYLTGFVVHCEIAEELAA
jgi:hypothetical protein